jgi:hypothetical protein
MRWRSTFWLVALAALLFGFIWGYERHTVSTDQRSASQPLLPGFHARDIEGISVQRTNSFILQVQRTNDAWTYLAPVSYPAEPVAVRALLELAEGLNRDFLVAEAAGRVAGEKTNRFGLDAPLAVLTLVQGSQRAELRLGARTLTGDQVYAQLAGSPGVYALPARLLDSLPVSLHDWRERTLGHWADFKYDRLTVSNATRGFTVGFDRTNLTFVLRKPFQARADNSKVLQLLSALKMAQVTRFVSDNPRVDLDPFGLQTPALQLSLGIDTNDLFTVQFGSSPTNEPGQVYARLLDHTNVVLVPRTVLDQLQPSFTDLRDPRLLTFPVAAVDTLEVRGPENFSVRRDSAGTWSVQPGGAVADAELIREVLGSFHELRIAEFANDFVTDFAPYGLATPGNQWVLRGAVTNAGSPGTNALLAQLDLGNVSGEKVYARRPDELSVYMIRRGDAARLPDESWKLRDRRVWSFTTNEVARVTIEQGGRKLQLRRTQDGKWEWAGGVVRAVDMFATEEAIHRLGQLRAAVWTARGDTNRAALGFVDNGHRISIELLRGGKPETLTVEFGGRAPSHYTYASTPIEGTPWFFEFPLELYFRVLRDLTIVRPEGF